MKKLSFVFAFALMASTATFAQQIKDSNYTSPEESAQMLTEIMSDYLKLNDQQTASLGAINLNYAQKTQSLLKKGNLSNEEITLFQSLVKNREAQWQALTSVAQWNRYKQYKMQIRADFRQYLQNQESVAARN